MPTTIENKKRLYSAIVKLPDGYIEPIILRYIKKQPNRRIAKAMGISIESVNSRLLRATNRLQSLMQDENE